MEKPNKIIKKESELNIEKIKETIGEDPLIVSGLKFDKEKYEKKVEVLKEMIKSDKIGQADKNRVKVAMIIYQAALNLEIPATGITILGGNPYINTAGLLYKTFEVAKDKGGIKKISSEPKQISDDVSKPAFFVSRVEFMDGSVFEEFGEASASNIKMSTIRPFLNSMASRRATNRAMRLATGIGLVSVEEIEGEVNDANKPVEERLLTEKEFKEIADWIAYVEGCASIDELDKFKIPEGINEYQIAFINKTVANKKKTLI